MKEYKTSTGHAFSTSEWLNLHFDAAKPEYESMVKDVGIQRGWHVLDAGCGNGKFIPIISELVGPYGHITALDLAPEHIAEIQERVLPSVTTEVTPIVGSVVTSDFPDHTFDAIWCSAVTQYLTADELWQTLHEFQRILKPEGVIGVKEYDGTVHFFYPTPGLTLLWKSVDTMDPFDKQRWFIHPLEMKRLLEDTGFTDVRQKTVLMERRHPLTEIEVQYIEGLILAGQMSWTNVDELSDNEKEQWNRLLSKSSEEYLLHQSNFYWREGHSLTVGLTA